MTRSDDTHENEAGMTPEEVKSELRYLRTENAHLRAMQERLPEKERQELEKKRKSSEAWGTNTANLTR